MSLAQFGAALLNPDAPLPDGLTDPQGRPAGRRFSVYRNNVAVGLTEALKTGFPVICKLVGEEFFTAMAGDFLRRHPPQNPLLMFYGDAFPDFLGQFPPVAHLPYLADVARLELALVASYHAADAAPMGMETIANLPPETLMASGFRLAPALRLLRSPYPVHGIWLANTADTPLPPGAGAEDVIILRPGFDPAPHRLPAGGHDFTSALLAGRSLGDAIAAGGPAFNLDTTLALLVQGGALIQTETAR